MNVCLEVKDEEFFWGRITVLGALMCLTFYLLVELGREMGKKQKEVN